jgi:hypothetical protein
MLKFLASIALLFLVWTASPVHADDCVTVEQMVTMNHPDKFIVMENDVAKFFIQELTNLTNSEAPEYDQVVVLQRNEVTVVALLKDGCHIGHTNPIPSALINSFLKEANGA